MNNSRYQHYISLFVAIIMMVLLFITQVTAVKPYNPELKKVPLSSYVHQNNITRNQQLIELNWSPNHKGFNIKSRGDSPIALEGLGGTVEINGQTYYLEDAKIISAPVITQDKGQTEGRLSLGEINCLWIWEVTYNNKEFEVTATIQNTGNEPLTIGRWDVINVSKNRKGIFKAGENPDNVRFFRWRPWDMRVEILNCENGQHSSDNICLLYDPISKQTFMSAFISMNRMHCRHNLHYSHINGIEEYTATCSFGNYELPPGKKLVSEKLRFSFHTNPYDALEGWADLIYSIKKPVFEDLPPVCLSSGAWFDSWNEYEGSYSKVALENARALRNKLKGFDIDIFRVSTFTSLKKGIPGNWLEASERHFTFTNGFENFLNELQKLGFKPGVWVAPFWFCGEANGVLEENYENLLRDCNGDPMTYPLNWGHLTDTTYLSRLHKYFLDGTHPKTFKFIKKVFDHYRNIGVRFYMLDFLQVPGNSCLFDPTQTPLQAADNILKLIRKTAGNDTHLQTAVSSTPAYCGLIDAARVGRDFGEGRPLQGAPLSDWGNATYILHDNHYANLHYLLQNTAASYFTHRKLYLNDLNLLSIDKPVPLDHARIATTIFGLCGSPFMLGDDMRRIDDERLNMIKLCLPRTQDWPVPTDLFEHVYPNDYSRYLKLAVEKPWGSYQLLAIFNNDETAYNAEIDFAGLNLDEKKPYRIYEFWEEKYCGTYRKQFKYIIPPNSCCLFRISEAREYPWLLSTDMHIQQGALEVETIRWDEKKMCLSGTMTRPAGEVGNLFFLMPRKMRVVNVEGLWLMKELEDMNVIIRKEIRFTKDHEDFEIFFEPWERKYVPGHLMPNATEEEWLDYIKDKRGQMDTRVYK